MLNFKWEAKQNEHEKFWDNFSIQTNLAFVVKLVKNIYQLTKN